MVLDRSFKSDDATAEIVAEEELLPLSAMPNLISFAVPAGTACVFDNATWHASLSHTAAGGDRRNVILSYGAWTLRSGMGHTAELLERAGKLKSESRRHLFGLAPASNA